MLNGLTTAFRTLSIIPVPGKDADNFSDALYGFVIVGGALGGLVWLEGFFMRLVIGNQWPEGVAFVLLVTGIFLTRGFHLDGVADFADGFWGGYNRERTLAIMKDSFLGTFGVIALVLVLLGKWIAMVRIIELSALHWVVCAYLISRTMLVELTVSFSYARQEGTAGAFIKGAKQKHRWFSLGLCAAVLYLLSGLPGLVLLLFSWGFARILGWWSQKRVGGITGDILGTCCELSETLVLFSAIGYEIFVVTYL
ncbi:adenosylcobinamide-GDP ribazoletransferase [bacterium]|nr:adenosylcobinamide-GDP ribazoletransferase [bacterium]